ncbi:hypothetical protein FRC09_016046 [Ceratobasidium sp. 395]|nr:hypothetical protein FRC09_016046 [Ceratobasidium sp. 395]
MANDGAIPSPRPRHIIVLCDGTGKNGEVDPKRGVPITNIWRLYQAVKPDADKVGDLCEYFAGVGAGENKEVAKMDLLARAFGHTAVVSIRDIYMYIAKNYEEGDSISLFGYSRGAFIVRKVASLVGKLGLITDPDTFNTYWKNLEHKLPGKRRSKLPQNVKPVPISCVGVWDTVGTIIRPLLLRPVLNLLTLPDDDLPDIVQSALHVVAYHENRKLFDVTLWKGGLSDDNWDKDEEGAKKSRVRQILFPGCHSDVGGGGEEPKDPKDGPNVLPDVTLDWMMRNMPQAIFPALPPSLATALPKTHKLISAFHDGQWWKRIPDSWFRRAYLIDESGLYRHRTLQALPSPESPHLLIHDWETVDDFGEEIPNGKPKDTLFGRLANRFAATVKQATVFRPHRRSAATAPPVPPASVSPAQHSPQMSRSVELQATPPRRPATQHFRPESSTTDQTDAMTDTHDTVSTPRTSIRSIDEQQEQQQHAQVEVCKPDDIIPEPGADIPDIPTPKAVPQSLPLPIVEEKIEPTMPEPEPKLLGPEQPISEKVAVAPTKPAVQIAPPVRQPAQVKKKKGLWQKIKTALCCGSSDQMDS